MDNLNLWNKVKTPDPKYVKNFKRGGGFKGSSTNTQYLIQRATELWGENGTGWGVTIDEECYQPGAPLIHENVVVGTEIIHIVRGHFWYVEEKTKKHTSQQFGQTTFVGQNKYGFFTDEEAPKKSVTDMMLKCMSLIGFSADIFLGLWDDNKYVSDARKSFNKETTKEGQVNEEKAIEALDNFVDPKNTDRPEVKLESLNALWSKHYKPKLNMFSPKGKTAVENTYKEVVSILEEQLNGPDTSKDIAEIDEKKAVDSLDVFADPADKRPPAIKLKLIEAFWNKHYEPNLHLFSDKGKSDVINTYHGVVDVLTSQGKDNERNN